MAALSALALVAVGASAAGDHAVAGDRYIGTTSQGQATTIVVSTNGRSVVAVLTAVAYDGRCGTHPGSLPYQILSDQKVTIRPSGGFREATQGTTAGRRLLPMIVTGTFGGGKVYGTIAAGGRGAHCPTPRQSDNPYVATFSARGTPAASP